MAKMTLSAYLDGMRAANTAADLDAAIHAPFKHRYRGATWERICKVRIERGHEIISAHPLGRFVPRVGPHRRLSVCDETYRVARGGNSTGVRYAWHAAMTWAIKVMMANGLGLRASHRVWGECREYPHRCIATLEAAFAGAIPDPQLDTIVFHKRDCGSPIQYTIEQNDADPYDRRATRPCHCGGTLFDWGAGHSEGFDYITWHCNACPDVATEYLSVGRLYEIRQSARQRLEAQEVQANG